jgi:protein-S-isoprenylcysteine O-methyltransferase Ste14
MNSITIVNDLVLVLAVLPGVFLASVITRAIIRKQPIIGRPPIPVFFFILAKLCVIVNFVFLYMSGLGIRPHAILGPTLIVVIPAILILILGFSILVVSSLQLNRGLIFGLPGKTQQNLQTKGIYGFSRHPFYMGFILILFSSCLLYPHIINILAFLTTWIIHHFIMIREEDFLEQTFGDEYRKYKGKVGRYITF